MSAAKEDSSSVRFSSRSRTPVSLYNPTSTVTTSEENHDFLNYGKGKGIPLSENEQFTHVLNKYTAQEEIVVNLHRLLYGVQGKNTMRKKNLRAFQGFVFDQNFTKEKVMTRLNDRKWTTNALKDLCDMLGIGKTGDKVALVDRLMEYFTKPYQGNVSASSRTSGSAKKASTNGKRKSHASHTEDGDNAKKTKRPLTAFFIFSQEMRTKIKKENPEFGVTDVARELGAQWRALSNAKKQPYIDRAAKLKEASDKEKEQSSSDGKVAKGRKSPEKKAASSTKAKSSKKDTKENDEELEEEVSPEENDLGKEKQTVEKENDEENVEEEATNEPKDE